MPISILAASVEAMEALKDQGVPRWNKAVRYALHHRSLSQANKLRSSDLVSSKLKINKAEKTEVMFLSCWCSKGTKE